MLEIAGHILAFLGAGAALLGDTWNGTARGWRKLTTTGWAAAFVATLGLILSVYVSVMDQTEKSTYREIALNDMAGGWRQIAIALHIMDDLGDGTIDNGALTFTDVQSYGSTEALTRFAELDFNQPVQLGNGRQPQLAELLCTSMARGMTVLDGTIRNRGVVLNHRIARLVADLSQSATYGGILAAGRCARGATDPDMNRIREELQKPQAVDFVQTLIALGEEIGEDRLTRR